MITATTATTGLALALLAVPAAPETDALPFAWQDVERASVRVVRPDHDYVVTLRVTADEGGGVVVARTGLEASLVLGVDPEAAELTPSQRASLAMLRTVPALRCDASGAFVELARVGPARADMVRELTEHGAEPRFQVRAKVWNPAFLRLWAAPPVAEWAVWGDGWAGTPLEPGVHRREGTWRTGLEEEDRIPVTFELEVHEPESRDGRRVVRVVRAALVESDERGLDISRFLSSIDSLPAERRYCQRFRTLWTVDARFDADTGLPVTMASTLVTELDMESPRRAWRDTIDHEAHYTFTFGDTGTGTDTGTDDDAR